MAMHRSRVCYFVIDVSNLDQGVAFWTAALGGTEEETPETSRPIYRCIRLPDSEIRILLQKTSDRKTSKERMHIDLETDNVEAEVERLEALGAVRYDHQQERGHDFWVLQDPWGNEFCVLQEQFPKLLARRGPWSTARPLWTDVPGQHSTQPPQCVAAARKRITRYTNQRAPTWSSAPSLTWYKPCLNSSDLA